MKDVMVTARRRAKRAKKLHTKASAQDEKMIDISPASSVADNVEEVKVTALTVSAMLYRMGDEDLAATVVTRHGVESEYKEMLRRMKNGL